MSLVAPVNLLFQAFYILLLLRVILSWAPVLTPVRRLLPVSGGVDLSPMVALLLLILTQRVAVDLLRRLDWAPGGGAVRGGWKQ